MVVILGLGGVANARWRVILKAHRFGCYKVHIDMLRNRYATATWLPFLGRTFLAERVVTANKQAIALDLDSYSSLRKGDRRREVSNGYEMTVGAGLPVR